MFKKFNAEENVSGHSQLKQSVQRVIRGKIVEQMPLIEPYMESLLPKKEKLIIVKCSGHINLILDATNRPLFFNIREGPYFPCLRLLHQLPFLLPHVQVDRGAIKFIMRGSDIMCPGLTSPGAKLETELPESTIVAVMAEGKQRAVGIGVLKMSTNDIKEINKGVGVENIHYLNDPLWKTLSI